MLLKYSVLLISQGDVMCGGGDLECQQALVDLGSFQAGLTVSAGRVCAPLISRQVDQRELSVHLPPPTKNDLEHGVAPRGVSVRWSLTRGPKGDAERQRQRQDKSWVMLSSNTRTPADAAVLPAAVSHFDELEDILRAFHLPLLQPDHLHLLLAVLQDP